MSSSKIKLKVQHQKHQKQQKSGAKLGKNENNQKYNKIIKQVQEQKFKLQKNEQKNKNKNKEQLIKQAEKNKKQNDKKNIKNNKQPQKEQKNNKNNKQLQRQRLKDRQNNNKQKQQKKDQQLQTISSINKQSNRAKLTIGQLINLYKDVSYDIFINHGHNPTKQKQIQLQLQKLQKQKEKRKIKIQQLRNLQEEKINIKEHRKQQKLKKKHQKEIQRKKINITQRLQSLSLLSKKRQQEHQKFKEYETERKRNHIPRYKKYQQQFKQFQEKIKQEKKQILQQIKIKAMPIDYEQLSKFQQHYHKQKVQTLEHSQNKSRLQKQILQKQNEWMKKLYKGSAYRKVKQQNLNQYEKYMTIAKQKQQKKKQYGKQIKIKLLNTEEKQIQNDSLKVQSYISENVTYRQKYVNGTCLGLVPEKKVKPLTHSQKQKLGVHYLEYIRTLPRKVNSTNLSNNTIEISKILQKEKIQNKKTYRMKRQKNPYYNIQRSGTSFDAKNPQDINMAIKLVKSKDQMTAFQQKSLQYLQYSDVLDLQKKHLNVNKRLIGDINSKLDILKKLVD